MTLPGTIIESGPLMTFISMCLDFETFPVSTGWELSHRMVNQSPQAFKASTTQVDKLAKLETKID